MATDSGGHMEARVRVAVVGSREASLVMQARVLHFVDSLPSDSVVVSGGASGVDRLAANAARRRSLSVIEHVPNYREHGQRAPLVRNIKIARDCDELVAFWNGESRGTLHTIAAAVRAGKPVRINP